MSIRETPARDVSAGSAIWTLEHAVAVAREYTGRHPGAVWTGRWAGGSAAGRTGTIEVVDQVEVSCVLGPRLSPPLGNGEFRFWAAMLRFLEEYRQLPTGCHERFVQEAEHSNTTHTGYVTNSQWTSIFGRKPNVISYSSAVRNITQCLHKLPTGRPAPRDLVKAVEGALKQRSAYNQYCHSSQHTLPFTWTLWTDIAEAVVNLDEDKVVPKELAPYLSSK